MTPDPLLDELKELLDQVDAIADTIPNQKLGSSKIGNIAAEIERLRAELERMFRQSFASAYYRRRLPMMTSDEKRDAIAEWLTDTLRTVAEFVGPMDDAGERAVALAVAILVPALLDGSEVPGVGIAMIGEQPEHPSWEGEHPYCWDGGKGLCWHGPGAEDDDVPLFRQVTP